jgi:hypothetical protein
MSMAGSDITIEILKDIRDATRATNLRLDSMESSLGGRLDVVTGRLDVVAERLDVVAARVDVATQRLDMVETTLLDLAQENRFVVRYLRAMFERHADLEPRVSALESRVDKLESK